MTLDSLPTLLALAAPVLLALAAAVGWLLNGRRKPPPSKAPPAIVAVIEDTHHRQVERIEADAREVIADAKRVDALPGSERNKAIGAKLRERR